VTATTEAWVGWVGFGECASMAHPPRKLSVLAMAIQMCRVVFNGFMMISSQLPVTVIWPVLSIWIKPRLCK